MAYVIPILTPVTQSYKHPIFKQKTLVISVRKRTMRIERSPLFGEVSTNFSG
jgi:hypothetical protein